VPTVTNGHEALELMQTSNFDLVFMDKHMPGTSGIETTKAFADSTGAAMYVHGLVVVVETYEFLGDNSLCSALVRDNDILKHAVNYVANEIARFVNDLDQERPTELLDVAVAS
jgi:CheY-like chemotaxis protein